MSVSKKAKALFRVKDISLHRACKICKNVFSCGESYTGETLRNVEIRWNQHNNSMKKLNLSRHIKDNVEHCLS